METLAKRLDACQEQLLELYEEDSKHLEKHVQHWKCLRIEAALLFKAREMGYAQVGHQIVPALEISRAKAHVAIEIQLALETLLQSTFGTEPWTLQETSYEMWHAEPKKCLKKQGRTVEVVFDGNPENAMHYTAWTFIYVQTLDGTWCKVYGHVCYAGLYYIVDNMKQFYCNFKNEAKKYGVTGQWEVHDGTQVIVSPASISSTTTTEAEVSSSGLTELVQTTDLYNTTPTPTTITRSNCDPDGTDGILYKDPTPTTPPRKRYRQSLQPPTKHLQHYGVTNVPVDPGSQRVTSDNNNNQRRNPCGNQTTPVIHLQGDPNCLKCLRWRLKKNCSHLFTQVSSTWHLTEKDYTRDSKDGIITIHYYNEEQRDKFLSTVKLPPGIKSCIGYMSMLQFM
ncbi:early protein [human papillomavirus 32]|uniref:Regulatory protein E2 n=2 Tax=Human papillomavirus type 32 TaxID=333763 RepID=VE2_HPV32|nr:early protein [Human papillomavirus type 32]P36791.1 RecName: Full=Regulatory protein E2 [Human papillomavirus type 32]ALT22401.1 E2 [Human papillomavirus type 32]CAA52552.1 early protein [Human papillomavirus type 32]